MKSSYPPPPGTTYDVIVAIDLQETGYNALHEALRLAAARPDVKLHVAHVVANVKAAEAKTDGLSRAEAVGKYVREQTRRMTDVQPTELTVHVRIGPVVRALIAMAIEIDAELIVVGTHGRTGLAKFALGSVANDLMASSPCPVLIARPKDYAGLTAESIEPLCEDCAAVRRETNGATAWCEYHSRPHIRPHAYGYADTFHIGRERPSIIP